MELFVGGLWGWLLESWRLLGTLLGGLGGSSGTFFGIGATLWRTFSDLGGSLGDLVAPNGSQKGRGIHQMAPRTDFFGFWIRFGIHFGRLLGPRVGFGRSFGSLLVAFGRSLGVFFWFCLGKCETMKSVVLL